jgi:hypothetical protein
MFLRLNLLQKQFWGYILVIFQFSINRHDSKHDTKHDTLYRFDSNGNIDYTDDNTDGEVFQTNFDYVDREGAGGHHHHGSHHHGSHHNGPHHGSHQGIHNNHHGSTGHHAHNPNNHHNNLVESHRTGRAEECYCVPVAQCPRPSVMSTSGFQDYRYVKPFDSKFQH